MRSIISILIVLVMIFAMVSISEAGFFWWSPYRCGIESPAHTDYIGAFFREDGSLMEQRCG